MMMMRRYKKKMMSLVFFHCCLVVVTHDEIGKRVWGSDSVAQSHTLNAQHSNTRALCPPPSPPQRA
jgi:hypothetical protein